MNHLKSYIKKIIPIKIINFILNKINKKKNNLEIINNKKKENKIIDTIFNNKDIKIMDGLFTGMLYTRESFCSAILPKLIGSYEEPIQQWINEIIQKKYRKIIDIGSAEGYYSVGLAIRCHDSQIYAYDIDDDALTANKNIAKLNKVEDKIIFKNLCDHDELNNIIDENTVIICDIEGNEFELLNPEKSPKLLDVDMIIESHDFINKNITEELINRFYKTHKIEIMVDYKRDIEKAKIYSSDIKIATFMVDEKRPEAMKWLRLTKLKNG